MVNTDSVEIFPGPRVRRLGGDWQKDAWLSEYHDTSSIQLAIVFALSRPWFFQLPENLAKHSEPRFHVIGGHTHAADQPSQFQIT